MVGFSYCMEYQVLIQAFGKIGYKCLNQNMTVFRRLVINAEYARLDQPSASELETSVLEEEIPE